MTLIVLFKDSMFQTIWLEALGKSCRKQLRLEKKLCSFNDGTTYPLCNKWNTENGETKKKEELEIFNSNSEESDQVTMEDGQSCSGTEGEA
ncbi:hypothetical protein V6N11_062134 [Hibiscus sabdariffa]|uniref:Uncharacterized protein n=1 Tax=Hibiscus sabdariffa TaxID=183260 RepID=A0ABR2PSG4_9ROSI